MKKSLFKLSAILMLMLVGMRWIYLEHRISLTNNIIFELNKGSQIDFDYINKMAEYQEGYYSLWKSCNDVLSKDLKGTITASELELFLPKYQQQAREVASQSAEITALKQKRTQEFSTFKYATVYRPE